MEAICHALERGNAGDLSALRALCHNDVVAEAGTLWPEGGSAVGVDAVVGAFRSMIEAFDQVESFPEQFIEVGDVLVVPLLWRGVPLGGSTTIEQHVVGAFTFAGDHLARLDYYRRVEEALAAVAARSASSSRTRK